MENFNFVQWDPRTDAGWALVSTWFLKELSLIERKTFSLIICKLRASTTETHIKRLQDHNSETQEPRTERKVDPRDQGGQFLITSP